jgi:hypothetical protein
MDNRCRMSLPVRGEVPETARKTATPRHRCSVFRAKARGAAGIVLPVKPDAVMLRTEEVCRPFAVLSWKAPNPTSSKQNRPHTSRKIMVTALSFPFFFRIKR